MAAKSVVVAVTNELTAITFYRGYLKYLNDMGWNVTLIASSEGFLDRFASEQGVNSVHVRMSREPSPLKDGASLFRWIRVLHRLRPDVVVVATPKASLLGLLAARIIACPVRVYQLWGLRLETETGWRRRLLSLLEALAIGNATDVVCNSLSLAAAVEREGLARGSQLRVLGDGSSHGVDLERFEASAQYPELPESVQEFLDLNKGLTVVGFVGRITADKGLDTLLQAVQICVDRDIRLCLVVVGQREDEDLVKRINAAAFTLPVILADATKDPRPYMAAFDVLCLPSRREGFPNVVLEAAAMGIPSVVTDSTGTVDSVVDGITGMVVPTDNVGELSAALQDVAYNENQWRGYGEAARRRVQEKFSQERLWRMQEEFLSDSLSLARDSQV